jgi:hypothetical protein
MSSVRSPTLTLFLETGVAVSVVLGVVAMGGGRLTGEVDVPVHIPFGALGQRNG